MANKTLAVGSSSKKIDTTVSGNLTVSTPGSGTYDALTRYTLYEADLKWGGKNFSASYGAIDAAMVPELGANRFAFLKAAGLTIEYSTDGGSTWVDYGATDAQKVGLFSNGQSFVLGKSTSKDTNTVNNQLRVTIDTGAAGIYTVLNKVAIYMSTSGNTVQVLMEKALQSTPTTYTTHLDWTGISGWSGWNILNISGITTYGNTAASQYGRLRFTFRQTAINANYTSANISKILAFGGQGWTVPSNMARNGHLYSYDSAQNATFPAKVTATGGFTGDLTGNASSATKATNDSDNNAINTTYLKLSGGTMTGVLTVKGNMYTDSYSGALNMANSNIYAVNSIYTADASDNSQEGIHFYRTATTVDTIYAASGNFYVVPNRTLGATGTAYKIYHEGNKPTKSDVGLGNVENTALSTWAGSSNLTTVSKGTIGDLAIINKGSGTINYLREDGTWQPLKATTTASLTVAGWSSNTQSVTVTGVTANNLVEVSPAPGSFDAYAKARVYCSAQAANSLTFKCTTTPTAALTVNIIIWN